MVVTEAAVARVQASEDADGIRVVVEGELDLTAWEVLGSLLHRLDGGCRRILLDLAGVVFVDLKGLDALLAFRDAALAAGSAVELQALPPGGPLGEMVELTMLGGRGTRS